MGAFIGFILFGLNTFGGIIGGVWLATLGEWSAILIGILVMVVSPIALSIAMLPGQFVFGVPGAALLDRGQRFFGLFFVFLSHAYTHLIVGAWCVAVFAYCLSVARDDSVWPFALWGYSVAIAPWAYLAGKDARSGGGEGAAITVFFAEIAFIAMAVAAIVFGWPRDRCLMLVAAILFASVVAQLALAFAIASEARRSRAFRT